MIGRSAFPITVSLVLAVYSYSWITNYRATVTIPQQEIQQLRQDRQRLEQAQSQPLKLELPDLPTLGVPQPPPPPKSYGTESSSATAPERDSTIEIEAEGVKLKIINEASVKMIIEFCSVWLFCLTTLFFYRYFSQRYIR